MNLTRIPNGGMLDIESTDPEALLFVLNRARERLTTFEATPEGAEPAIARAMALLRRDMDQWEQFAYYGPNRFRTLAVRPFYLLRNNPPKGQEPDEVVMRVAHSGVQYAHKMPPHAT